MARIRSVHPGLWTDEAFVSLSPMARLLAIGIWTEADDAGVFPWKPLQLKMRLLPADQADVAQLLEELHGAGAVMRYEVDGAHYGAIRNFRKFQKPERPKFTHPVPDEVAEFVGYDCNSHNCSKKPHAPTGGPPPEPRDSMSDHRRVGDAALTEHRSVGDESVNDHRKPGPRERRGIGEEEDSTSYESLEGGSGARRARPRPPPRGENPSLLLPLRGGGQARAQRLPGDWRPSGEDRAFAEGLGLAVEAVVAKFRDHFLGAAGPNAVSADWGARFRNWCREDAGGGARTAPRAIVPPPISLNAQEAEPTDPDGLSRADRLWLDRYDHAAAGGNAAEVLKTASVLRQHAPAAWAVIQRRHAHGTAVA